MRRCAVVHVDTGVKRLEAEALGLTRSNLRRHRPTTRAGHCMQINRVRQLAVRRIGKREFDGITDPYPDHRARNRAVERPECIGAAITEVTYHLTSRQLYSYRLCRAGTNRCWNCICR